MGDRVQRAVAREDDFWQLVDDRGAVLSSFLAWAADCEDGGVHTSLRFENRGDMQRCRQVLDLFEESWWGVVVYSCFDSKIGTREVADIFAEPLPPEAAETELAGVDFPRSSVQHHRAQATLTGAKTSLVSACRKQDVLRRIFTAPNGGFEDRFERLMGDRPRWWGRTTCFDALGRAGVLNVADVGYRPQKAHLAGSTGPKAGFKALFGVPVNKSNSDACEELLRIWNGRWDEVADRVGAKWEHAPYDSADFENALCIFQEPPHGDLPDPQNYRPATSRAKPERSPQC